MRDNIILKCTVCGEENYIGSKNKKKSSRAPWNKKVLL
jgi:ribosomal protein L33